MNDPFHEALAKAMHQRNEVLEQGLENTIRFWATDTLPEGEIRVIDISRLIFEDHLQTDGSHEHWVTMPGKTPVMIARSGFKAEGNVLKFWVERRPGD